MVWDVVQFRAAIGRACRTLTLAARAAIGIGDRQVKTAHERTPSDAVGIEQVADV